MSRRDLRESDTLFQWCIFHHFRNSNWVSAMGAVAGGSRRTLTGVLPKKDGAPGFTKTPFALVFCPAADRPKSRFIPPWQRPLLCLSGEKRARRLLRRR